MKTLIFAVAGYNLTETSRHIEIAGACRDFFNVDAPIKGTKNGPQIAFFSDFQVKKIKIFQIPGNFS